MKKLYNKSDGRTRSESGWNIPVVIMYGFKVIGVVKNFNIESLQTADLTVCTFSYFFKNL